MAPTMETPLAKKKTTVIRRLLSPGLFSADSGKRKDHSGIGIVSSSASPPKETAFVHCPEASKRPKIPVTFKNEERKLENEIKLPIPRSRGYVTDSCSSISSATSSEPWRNGERLYEDDGGFNLRANGMERGNRPSANEGTSGRTSAPPAPPYSQYYSNKDGTCVYRTWASPVQMGTARIYGNVAKPSAVYVEQRPKSASPNSMTGSQEFSRGCYQRSTISGYHPRQSVIYEEAGKDVRTRTIARFGLGTNPIFKRGTLIPRGGTPSPAPLGEASSNSCIKRVSFSPNKESPQAWPTKKGPAMEPPTRQSKQEAGLYANVVVEAVRPLPLPPVPVYSRRRESASGNGNLYGTLGKGSSLRPLPGKWQMHSESESGSEAGEVQRILQNGLLLLKDEDWNGDQKRGNDHSGANRLEEDGRKGRIPSNRRDDPRRHTLAGDQSGAYHPAARSIDLESSRGYQSSNNSVLFDDDPGIMSEVETSSTGFRRGNKQRSSLPVVRTPSKTFEQPLGMVFLQYRNETKRAVLPNEITSLITVKALFVRSFSKQLTMEFMESPQVKIYIHDSSKDMFYELEEAEAHLSEIRDRSVLRLFQSGDGGPPPSGLAGTASSQSISATTSWDPDQNYFSEPEFDSEYHEQHIHKSKANNKTVPAVPLPPYYPATRSFPPGSSATLPRTSLLRPYSPAGIKPHAGFSPERGPARSFGPFIRAGYDADPYYAQYSNRPPSIAPIIDEEPLGEAELVEEAYNLYGNVKLPTVAGRPPQYGMSPVGTGRPPFDPTRLRVEHMERQLANLTGLVQKALRPSPSPSPSPMNLSMDDTLLRPPDKKPPKLGKDRSVSFEKSVSFSDDPPEMNSHKQHSPQHTDTKPAKPAIKCSTLPRMSSQEKLKPAPPPKPASLVSNQYDCSIYKDLRLSPEMYNHLRSLQKQARDMRIEMRNLRRTSQAQAYAVNETLRDTFVKLRAILLNGGESLWSGGGGDLDRIRISREEDIYKQEMLRLENDLTKLEATIEELRANVINKKSRVNMAEVEKMALILRKSSKAVADLKVKFPILQNAVRSVITQDMEKAISEEAFLKDEPDRLDSALRRCKKLTGTLVTLKRLASVQEQRIPDSKHSPGTDEAPPVTPTTGKIDIQTSSLNGGIRNGGSGRNAATLDVLLDELQSQPHTAKPATTPKLRMPRDKPPIPERNELTGKRIPPPPPPRTSSKSPMASPTTPQPKDDSKLQIPAKKGKSFENNNKQQLCGEKEETIKGESATSSSCESINSQEGAQSRHDQLEVRHRELLMKQKALQEQYTRLQEMQKTPPPPDLLQLKKTGSDGNVTGKLGLTLSCANPTNAAGGVLNDNNNLDKMPHTNNGVVNKNGKIYETEIL